MNNKLESLRAMLCAVGVVGRIDGHQVVRRESVLELVDRARKQGASDQAQGEVVACVRVRADGTLSGDWLWDGNIEQVRKDSGGWKPLTFAAPPQAALGDAEHWRFIANEWADVATNGLQWLRNIAEGASKVDDALANMQDCVTRVTALQHAGPAAAPGADRSGSAEKAASFSPSEDLMLRCLELLQMHDGGTEHHPALEALAASFDGRISTRCRRSMAESQTQEEAMRFVLAAPSAPTVVATGFVKQAVSDADISAALEFMADADSPEKMSSVCRQLRPELVAELARRRIIDEKYAPAAPAPSASPAALTDEHAEAAEAAQLEALSESTRLRFLMDRYPGQTQFGRARVLAIMLNYARALLVALPAKDNSNG